MLTSTRMCFGYGNIIRPANITTVALTNVAATGLHPESNLKYPDPWMQFKTATPTGEPIIRFEFAGTPGQGAGTRRFANMHS